MLIEKSGLEILRIETLMGGGVSFQNRISVPIFPAVRPALLTREERLLAVAVVALRHTLEPDLSGVAFGPGYGSVNEESWSHLFP